MEPQAQDSSEGFAKGRTAAYRRLAPQRLGIAFALVFGALAFGALGTAEAQTPQPDPSPTGADLSPAPDPVPGATPPTPPPAAPPPATPAPTPPAPVTPVAPPEPAVVPAGDQPTPSQPSAEPAVSARTVSVAPQAQPSAEPAASARATARRRQKERRAAAERLSTAAEKVAVATVQPVQIKSLLPSVSSGDESRSGLLLLAAGILLVLAMVSGTLLAVATRVMNGQLR